MSSAAKGPELELRLRLVQLITVHYSIIKGPNFPSPFSQAIDFLDMRSSISHGTALEPGAWNTH